MPQNISRYSTWLGSEVLKYPQMHLTKLSAVLDATMISMNVDPSQRTIVPAGTILALSATRAGTVFPYAGTGTIMGILADNIDIISNVTNGSEAVPVLFHEALFATTKIVNFTLYATLLVPALSSCKFL